MVRRLVLEAFSLARRSWRQLTSMRTALVLLFLLAVAAIPGSVLPQRNVSPEKVRTYLGTHKQWGPTLDRLFFFAVYGSPVVQAIAGIDAASTRPMRKAPKSWLHKELLQARIAELRARIPIGGLREAMIRSLLYVGMSSGGVDERGFEMVRRIHRSQSGMPQLPVAAFKSLVREQYLMLLVDPEGAVAAIPSMLPADPEVCRDGLDLLKRVLSARGKLGGEAAERLQQIERLFRIDRELIDVAAPALAPARQTESRKAS